MRTIEITEEAYELLCERMGNTAADSFSDLIIAMDECAEIMTRKRLGGSTRSPISVLTGEPISPITAKLEKFHDGKHS
jgi:hypothetical protein